MDNEATFLKIKIDGPSKVPVDAFRHVINGMSEVVSEVDKSLDGKGRKAFRWDLADLEYGSAVFVIQPTPVRFVTTEKERAISRIIREGIAAIQARQKQRPDGFNDKALRALRTMVKSLPKRFTLAIADDQVTVDVNLETVVQIDEWLAGRYEEYGTVEGKLDRVFGHNKLEFTIYDEQENRIDCFVSPDKKDLVKQALYENVSVRGRIIYRADGVPVAIYPTEIEEIEEPVFDLREFIGVLDLDVPSEEYVRSLRDE